MRYRKKPDTFEAVTFDELAQYVKATKSPVEYGRAFAYQGREVVCVDDERFLVAGALLTKDVAFIWSNDGSMNVCDATRFAQLFEVVPE